MHMAPSTSEACISWVLFHPLTGIPVPCYQPSRQTFPSQNCPEVCGHQHYSFILETDNNCLAVNSLDIITV